MRPKIFREYSYGSESEKWEDLGVLVVEFNESEAYEQNATKLYKKGAKYTLLASNGCSCWDGEWEGWENITAKELKTLGASWAKDWGKAEKAIGEWIVDNIRIG